ncbi:hypothetical protein TNCT_636901 [Trichonephila clavata]|uniref:Uncharacterized protein n=1 Tax=Trichonephila clavata TaxID=2740835 RepID=A0A8X6H1R6_TRICU|nr:hypothetical protein TNCT_636901 [Trichonephila clavata]
MSTFQRRNQSEKEKYKPKPTIKDPKRNFNSFSPTMNPSDKPWYCMGHPVVFLQTCVAKEIIFFLLFSNLPAKISVRPNVNGRFKTLDETAKRALIVVIAGTIIREVNF